MRRAWILFLVLILLSPGVFAQSNGTGNITGNITGLVDADEAKSKTNEVLAKELEVPENLQFAARVAFGMKADDPVDLQTFIILLCVFLILIIILRSAFELVPIVGEGWKAWAVAVIVTLLVGASGGIILAAKTFLTLGGIFGVLEGWGVIQIIITVVILVLLAYGAMILNKIIKRSVGDAKAVRRGEIINRFTTTAEIAEGG